MSSSLTTDAGDVTGAEVEISAVEVEAVVAVVVEVVFGVVVDVGRGVVIGIRTGVVEDVVASDPVTRIGRRFEPATTADEAEIEKMFFISWEKMKLISLTRV